MFRPLPRPRYWGPGSSELRLLPEYTLGGASLISPTAREGRCGRLGGIGRVKNLVPAPPLPRPPSTREECRGQAGGGAVEIASQAGDVLRTSFQAAGHARNRPTLRRQRPANRVSERG